MNPLALPLLIACILLFIAVLALIFAFKTGDELKKEYNEALKRIDEQDKEIKYYVNENNKSNS